MSSFETFKLKLRFSFLFFMGLLVSRTIYFTKVKIEALLDLSHHSISFNEQIYIYLSELFLSLIILGFIIKSGAAAILDN